jgi:hypothetical protein
VGMSGWRSQDFPGRSWRVHSDPSLQRANTLPLYVSLEASTAIWMILRVAGVGADCVGASEAVTREYHGCRGTTIEMCW